MTHAEIVDRAVRWLRRTRGCRVVYAELATAAVCIPDAIGWRMGQSELVEVKVSRSDFARDRDKHAHRSGALPGERRWYLTPPGLLRSGEIPEGWGLAEVRPTFVRIVVEAPHVGLDAAGLRTERLLLTSAARRHELRVPFDAERGRFATLDEQQRAALAG